MAAVDNRSGAPHFWFEQAGPQGERIDVLIVRATFDFSANGELMSFAKQQHPVVFGDKFAGPANSDPLRAVLQEDGDLLPYKPGTDILVTGHAEAPDGRAQPDWLASICVGQVRKDLRVHGPRQFRKGLFGWRLDPTEPAGRIPLDYRLAFGGCIDVPANLTADGQPDAIKHPGNPAGRGWLPDATACKQLSRPARQHIAKLIKGLKLIPAPQIEAAAEPIRRPYQNSAAQGVSAIARWWEPRLAYQGTYNDHWRKVRYPLLPEDFDSRYYQSAHPDLIAIPHLRGDEIVTLTGLLPQRRDMRLPGWRLIVVVTRASGESSVSIPLLDTVRLDLDVGQASLVWRTHFDCDDPVIEIALAATTAVFDADQLLSSALLAGEVD
jgi:hypothetical protein